VIAQALAEAKLVTISSDSQGAANTTTNNITGVIQTVLAAQLVTRGGLLDAGVRDGSANGAESLPASAPDKGRR